MMKNKIIFQNIRIFLFTVDLLIISSLIYFYLEYNILNFIFLNTFWITISLLFFFQRNQNKTSVLHILWINFRRFLLFLLLCLSYFYIVDIHGSKYNLLYFFSSTYVLLNFWRILGYIIIKKYKTLNNFSLIKTVVIGSNETTKKLIRFFEKEKNLFQYLGFFTTKDENGKIGDFEDSFSFILGNDVDEIYCSIKELSNSQINQLIYFADNNIRTLKFIPDSKFIFTKKLKFDSYDFIPILSLREIPLKISVNGIIKRTFDIVFSLIIIFGFLSWFTPVLAILIFLESKGNVFFKQMRYGADFNLFACYKFRSMKTNLHSDSLQASKNDLRVTNIGKFIRKTSLDELPQFYNVLFGNMSVVGPRPLLLSHTNDYKYRINKFMVRHTVKPGITGLAQVSGYRGNIEKDLDMYNRIKYDVFYVENWSLLLDLKIIIRTVVNVFKGEDKAY